MKTICHGAIAFGNNPDRVRGRRLTGFTFEEDRQVESMAGADFKIPHYPQKVLEETGAIYTNAEPWAPYVVRDGKLLTGQNQQSASEYGVALFCAMSGRSLIQSFNGYGSPPFQPPQENRASQTLKKDTNK